MAFPIGKGDLAPSLTVQLKQAGVPMILDGCTVEFVMGLELGGIEKVRASAVVLNPSATITDPDCGKVRYDWGPGDTDTDGTYLGEFEVTLPSGKPMTFPNNEKKKIKIVVGKTVGGP